MATLSPVLQQATPIVAARGEGAYLYDEDGNRFLDFTSGIAVTSTGHCHPRVVDAIQRQAANLIHGQYGIVRHRPLLDLLDRLGRVLPAGLDSVFFANSGAEAVEAALRLVRQASGRQNVIVFHGGFHGRTIAGASLTTSNARFRNRIGPLMAGVAIAPFPNPSHYGWDEEETTRFCLSELDYLFATVTDPGDTAGILVEPVLGEAGYVPGNREFFAGLRERADRYGIALVADEVQTGVGRTGQFWASEHFDLVPDVIVFAKGIASGMPLSGIAASSELMRQALPGSQGGTYGANAISCAAAVATLDVIEADGLVENARRRGDQLHEGLARIAEQAGDRARIHGLGLLQACELANADASPWTEAAAAIQREALARGLVALTCGPFANIVRLMPPLVVTEQQIDAALTTLEESVRSVLEQAAVAR
jgi:4-aminobutyrate aminotransferase